MKYVDLVVDNRNDNTDVFYTYQCKFDDVKIGDKVYVPFNRGNKIKEAYVFNVKDCCEEKIANIKDVVSIDEEVSLNEEIVETCVWLKRRYFCRYIDAVKLFLPTGKKPVRRKISEVVNDFQGEKQDIEKLTDEQQAAVDEINKSTEKGVQELFLLQGVTGSGKTEVYMRAVKKTIDMGKNAIVLVPEVSLAKQIVDRFIERFGRNNIAVMHSKLSPSERYDQWQKIKRGDSKIIIGARLAVFAPIENIGLIILDEEHEATYKSDMTPKYDTAEVAIKRSKRYGGSVIMGSATPSVVSLYRSKQGIYKKLLLKDRYNGVQLPEVFVADMRNELKNGNKSVLSKKLYDEMVQCIDKKKQTILLINKRGYSSFVSCRNCGYVVKCSKCGIAMTYHKKSDGMVCHYCGNKEATPDICPECGSGYIKYFGAGTEKVCEEVRELFPNAKIERLDFDTGQKKGEINRILSRFAKGETDILVGTQLVGKGLDFRNVLLTGIIALDSTLNIPDYRSSERGFQMITQAGGRAGRGEERGKVVVQTYDPDSFAVVAGANHDTEAFYKKEIKIRELMNYPPFGSFAQINILGKDKKAVVETTGRWLKNIETTMGKNVIIGKKKNFNGKDFKMMMLIKFSNKDRNKFVNMAEGLKNKLREEKCKCSSIIDINPYSTWRN